MQNSWKITLTIILGVMTSPRKANRSVRSSGKIRHYISSPRGSCSAAQKSKHAISTIKLLMKPKVSTQELIQNKKKRKVEGT